MTEERIEELYSEGYKLGLLNGAAASTKTKKIGPRISLKKNVAAYTQEEKEMWRRGYNSGYLFGKRHPDEIETRMQS